MKNIHTIQKNNGNKNNNNVSNKKERRYRDVKTQKASEQGYVANIWPKLNKPLPYNPT